MPSDPDQPTMDSHPLAVLVGRLEERLIQRDERFEERWDAQDVVLTEIRAQTRLTNGRVTALERQKIEEEAARKERALILSEQGTIATTKRSRREWIVGVVIALFSIAASTAAALILG